MRFYVDVNYWFLSGFGKITFIIFFMRSNYPEKKTTGGVGIILPKKPYLIGFGSSGWGLST